MIATIVSGGGNPVGVVVKANYKSPGSLIEAHQGPIAISIQPKPIDKGNERNRDAVAATVPLNVPVLNEMSPAKLLGLKLSTNRQSGVNCMLSSESTILRTNRLPTSDVFSWPWYSNLSFSSTEV